MSAKFCHFAINADDVPRARAFYESVCGWTFEPWGPPDFYQIKNAGEGVRLRAFEPTVGVEDLGATMKAVEANGGKILMQPYRIEGVGELIFFEDTEGNMVGAMQYEPGVFD